VKRHGQLWDKLTSFANLVRAADAARKGKRHRPNVARFDFDLEKELCRLQDELRSHTYVPGEYRSFLIHEPKQRLISAAPYRDRIVHHALVRILAAIFEPTFDYDSYACRRGKGTHAAVDRFTVFARRHRYVLKCDVRKYFPSIDHEILKGLVARKIKDPDVLGLVNRIIDGSNPQEEVQEWFPGDELFTPAGRRRGLPIGNQTSQFFANVYLNPFDHWVRQTLRARCYIRYMDDFVLFGDDKRWLADARECCRAFLVSLRLRLHPDKSVISRVADGTRFLGFRVFPDHRRLPLANVVRMRRRLRRLAAGYAAGELAWPDVSRRILSWMGHARHADTYRLCERLFAEVVFRRKAV
jgi:retron-type reverse transcriptase